MFSCLLHIYNTNKSLSDELRQPHMVMSKRSSSAAQDEVSHINPAALNQYPRVSIRPALFTSSDREQSVLTPCQRQRLLKLLQVVVSLCDHHPDGILVCGGFIPLELVSRPVSEVLPVCLVWYLPYGSQHVSVNPQNFLSL